MDLRSRLLTLERSAVFVDSGRDERIGVKEVACDVEANDALRGSRPRDDRGEGGQDVVGPLGLGTHLLTKNDH